jgi:hypothetical protein
MLRSVHVGTRVKVAGRFYPAGSETLMSPSAVVGKVRSPSFVTSVVPATEVSTGVWSVEFTPDTAGEWQVQIAGTGAVQAVEIGNRDRGPEPLDPHSSVDRAADS